MKTVQKHDSEFQIADDNAPGGTRAIQFGEFDNSVTMMYRIAKIFGVPTEYLYTEPLGISKGKRINSIKKYIENNYRVKDLLANYIDLYKYDLSVTPVDLSRFYSSINFGLYLAHYDANMRREAQSQGRFVPAEGFRPSEGEIDLFTRKQIAEVDKLYNYINDQPTEGGGVRSLKLNLPSKGSLSDFRKSLSVFEVTYTNLLEREELLRNDFLDVQGKLSRVENPRVCSEPVIETSTIRYTPRWKNGKEIDIRDGIDMFSELTPTFNVPFIQYVDEEGDIKTWIYHGSKENDDEPVLDNIIQLSRKTEKRNCFFITVCQVKDSLTEVLSKKSYVRVIYYLETGHIDIPSPTDGGGIQRMKDRVSECLHMIELGEGNEIRIRGHFNMDNLRIFDAVLHYLIVNDETFSTYLFIGESVTSRAEKVRLNIHYRSLGKDQYELDNTDIRKTTASPVTISFGIPEVKKSDNLELGKTPDTTVRVNVIKANSTAVLREFMNIFSRLMAIYLDSITQVSSLFHDLISPASCAETLPIQETNKGIESLTSGTTFNTSRTITSGWTPTPYESDVDSVSSGGSKTKRKTKKKAKSSDNDISLPEKRNKVLRKSYPEVFVTQYSRHCSCMLQPIIIPEDEIESWRMLTFNKNGIEMQREVLPFPPMKPGDPTYKPLFWFVCPLNKYTYPHYKGHGKSPISNSKVFPYLPCCKTRPTDITPETYWRALQNPSTINTISETTKAGYRITNSGPVEPGRQGTLSPVIKDVLRGGLKGSETSDFVRIGVPLSPNSLIHCILTAVNVQHYTIHGKNYAEKEKYCVRVRKEMLAKITDPMLYKQELYDLSVEEIFEKLNDESVNFDPYIFYRAIEEAFNVNIYVFNNTNGINPITREKITDPILEIPRSKVMHVRHKRSKYLDFTSGEIKDRKVLIIHKTKGIDSKKNSSMHCEIIASVDSCCGVSGRKSSQSKYPTMLFDLEMDSQLQSITKYSSNVMSCSFTPDDMDNIRIRSNPFLEYDWGEILKNASQDPDYEIVGQRVDGYGKLRIIGFNCTDSKGGKHQITIYTPPSQPLNVPYLKEIKACDYDIVKQVFGEASTRTRTGVWYQLMDYDYGLYIACTNVEETIPIAEMLAPIRDETHDRIDARDPITQIRETKKNVNILLQIIEWLWKLDNNPNLQEFNLWWQLYVKFVPNGEEEANQRPNFYHRLPEVDNTIDGIKSLYEEKWWPYYFRKDGVYLYESLYIKIYKYFLRKEHDYDGLTGINIEPATHVKGLRVNDIDFKPKHNSIVFTELNHLSSWLEYQTSDRSVNHINTKINISMSSHHVPYMFKHKKHLYLVQNVKGGKFERAVNLLNIWYREHVNVGYDVPEKSPFTVDFPYVVYGISKSNNLIPLINMTTETTNSYAEFVAYSIKTDPLTGKIIDGNIAALIPLF